MAIKGIDKVVDNINKELASINGRSLRGLLTAGLYILGQSSRKVPVEYGKLRASGYARKSQAKKNAVEIGYTAAYAFFVHEKVGEKLRGKKRRSGIGVYWGPSGEAKFLEKAMRENRGRIIGIVAKDARRAK